jgi:hypothetical protein
MFTKCIYANINTSDLSFVLILYVLNAKISPKTMVLGEEFDSPVVSALGVRSRKLSNVGRSSDGWP